MKYVSDDGKVYENLKDCEKADQAYAENHKAKLELKEQRVKDAKELEDLQNKYVEMVKSHRKEEAELSNEFYKKRAEFNKKYMGYHYTYVGTSIDDFLNEFIQKIFG